MKQYLKKALILAFGLVVFQLVESIAVYLSNTRLSLIMETALREGYLAVPNALILNRLQGPGMALAGGLFYTLTVGTLVTLSALVASRLFQILPDEKRVKIPLFLFCFIMILVWINIDGILLLESIAITLTTGLVFALDHLFFNHESSTVSLKRTLPHLFSPLILALVLFGFSKGADNRIFSDFRDTFLMNNPVGMAINDFYYEYTLSPAEVFKSQSQKLIKTAVIHTAGPDPGMTRRVERKLLSMDYLVMAMDAEPDIRLGINGDTLDISCRGHRVVAAPVRRFLTDSRSVLSEVSKKTDKYSQYRILTRLGLLSGFPLVMYLILHMAVYLPIGMVMQAAKASAFASGICFALGLAAFGILFMMNPVTMDTASISGGLSSPDLSTRLCALRLIHDGKGNMIDYPESDPAYASPHVVERYWAARASAFSRNPETYDRLLLLLNDDNLNVQTQACYALGLSGNKRAITPIFTRISTSKHWYVQWYAYKALKRLGWTQKKSNR